MEIMEPAWFDIIYPYAIGVIRILTVVSILYFIAQRRSAKKATAFAKRNSAHPTSIICTNCGLSNPSVWEKCERCGASLSETATPSTPEDAAPPPLVKKV